MSQENNIIQLWLFLAFLQTLDRLNIRMPGNGIDRNVAMEFAHKYGKHNE